MSMLFKRIKDWTTSITAFRTDDVIPVDGPSGTAKMSKDNLLKETAENAVNSGVAAPYSFVEEVTENLMSTGENLRPGASLLSQYRITDTGSIVSHVSYRIRYVPCNKGDIFYLHLYVDTNRYDRVGVCATIPEAGASVSKLLFQSVEGDQGNYVDVLVTADIDGYLCISTGAAGEGQNWYRLVTKYGRLDEIEERQELRKGLEYVHGGYSSASGSPNTNVARIRFDEYLLNNEDVVHFEQNSVVVEGVTKALQYVVNAYDENYVFIGVAQGFTTLSTLEYVPKVNNQNCKYVRLSFRLGTSSSTTIPEITDDMISALGSVSSSRQIKNEIEMLAKEIEDLAPVDALPEGYGPYLANKLAKIDALELSVGSQNDSFIFFTDQHLFSKTGGKVNFLLFPEIIKRLLDGAAAKKVFSGGDYVYSEATAASAEKSSLYFRKNFIPLIGGFAGVYQVQGNHDVVYGEGNATRYAQSVVASIFADGSSNVVRNESDMDGTYFYVDNPRTKIRYIVFQTTKMPTGGNINADVVQTKWICEKAILTLESGWKIVAFSHIPSGSAVIDGARYASTNSVVIDILSAVNRKSSITIDGVTFDFSGLDVSVVAYFCGHHHADLQTFYNGVWSIATSSDAPFSDGAARSMYFSHAIPRGSTQRTEWEKIEGNDFTTNEQIIDYCVVDVSNDILNCVRVGAYYDRKFHIAPITLSVNDTLTLTPTISGTLTWHIYDNETARPDTYVVEDDATISSVWTGLDTSSYASVSGGVVSGVSAGTCVVMAMDENGNKEHWAIVVQ